MAAVLFLVVLAQASMLDTGLCGPPGSRLEEGNSGLKKFGHAAHKNVSLESVLELLQALDLVAKLHTKEASSNGSNTQQQENVTSHQPARNMSKGHQNYTPGHSMSKDYHNGALSHDQPSHNMSKSHQNDSFRLDQAARGMSLDQAARGMSLDQAARGMSLDQAARGMSLDQAARGMSLDQAARGMSLDQAARGMSLDQAARGMSRGYQNDAFHVDQPGRSMNLDQNDRDDDDDDAFNVMV